MKELWEYWAKVDIHNVSWPPLIFVLGISIAGLIAIIAQDAKRRNVTKNISVKPHSLRPLHPDETRVLHKKLDRYNKQLYIAGSLLFILLIGIILFIMINNVDYAVYSMFGAVFFLCLVIDTLIHIPKFKKDLETDVYEIRGEIFKDIEFAGYQIYKGYYMTVGNIRFHFRVLVDVLGKVKGTQPLYSFYETVNNGDEVEVLYSPATKYIWSIKKAHEQ